jgi:putative membrane protein
MMKYAWSVATVALVALSAMAFEDAKKEKCDNSSFVKKASCGNLAEIKMGKLAQEHAASTEVIAGMMVKAHTKAQEELHEACKASKTECPAKMTKEGKETCEKCEKLKGEKNFDAVYISTQVACHEKALKLYESACKECECEKLKAYAEKNT